MLNFLKLEWKEFVDMEFSSQVVSNTCFNLEMFTRNGAKFAHTLLSEVNV